MTYNRKIGRCNNNGYRGSSERGGSQGATDNNGEPQEREEVE